MTRPAWTDSALIAAAALLSHALALRDGLVFDDLLAIVRNPRVTGPFDLRAILANDYWGGHHIGTWRPLVVATFWLDQHAGGGAPLPFHASNLAWHAFACVMFAWAVRAYSGRPVALAAGVTFASLAVCTEAVTGVVGRADVMAAAFSFTAWGLVAHRTRSRGAALGAFVAMAAGVACKESAAAFPVFIALALVVSHGVRRAWRSAVWPAAGAFAMLLVHAVTYGTAGSITRIWNNNPLLGEPLPFRILTAPRLFHLFVQLVAAPFNLSADYSFAALMPVHAITVDTATGTLLVAALVALAWWGRRRLPAVTVAVLLVLVSFGVVAQIVFVLPTIFAERLLYLPAAGFAWLFALALRALAARRGVRLATVLGGLVVAMNVAVDVVRDGEWHDGLALFASTVATMPNCARAWNNYGAELETAGRRSEALAAYASAMRIAPRWPEPVAHAGGVLDQLGRLPEAYGTLQLAQRLDPADETPAAVNLATFLARHGHLAEAEALLADVCARHPADRPAHDLLAHVRADRARNAIAPQ